MRKSRPVLRFSALVLLVVCAAAFRLSDINWDQFQHVHPDERFIVWVADSMSLPESLAQAFDPLRSPINPFRWPPGKDDPLSGKPRGYAYGHFPLYLLVFVAHAAQAVGQWFGETTLAFPAFLTPIYTVGRHLAEYNYLALVGRALSALADLATLLLVYVLGRRVGGRLKTVAGDQDAHRAGGKGQGSGAGLLAAALYTFAVLPIQLSHYFAVDMVTTVCVVGSVALAASQAERWAAEGGGLRRGWLRWLLAAGLAGLAVGSKFSAVMLIVPLAVAALYGVRPDPPAPFPGREGGDKLPSPERRGVGGKVLTAEQAVVVLGRLAAAMLASAVAFAVTNPFAILEPLAYAANILSQNAMVSGIMDAPYTRQYIGTPVYWYFIQQLSQWGVGWPLGAIAWGGFVWAIVAAGLRRGSPTLVVMLAWALPYFATTGAFHTKFLRYMAPLLPFLLVFGAGALTAACRWLRGRWGRAGQAGWAAAVLAALALTIGWALAFTSVYHQEHPWIQASRWIYEQIPEGSKLLVEHWDDALPLTLDNIPGRPAPRTYVRAELPLWDPDKPAKLDKLVAELSSADYVVLSSNRLYAPIQRLAARYPMSSQYYRLLFAGDLGYTLVAEFSVYPRLGGLVIRDDRADESFTVYDHPRALVFANTDRLSASLLRARLGRYLPETSRPPGHARLLPQAPAPDAPLTLKQPADTLPVVDDFRWNRLASEWQPLAVLLWYLILGILGWAAWPLIFPLFGGLQDRGYGLSRVAGWLLVGWAHWLGVSLGWWQHRLGMIALCLALLVLAGLLAWRAQRCQMAAFWSERRRLVLGEEALFIAAFAMLVGVRLLNPDLWQPWNGGEKFMEFAFLNATLRSPQFPPYDPYFAGGVINYYYYGLYLVGLLIKLTGIAAEVAFNLAVPGIFALTALALFSVGYSLARRVRSALLGVLFALLMGNLASLGEGLRGLIALGGQRMSYNQPLVGYLGPLFTGLRQALAGATLPRYDYWAPSRVIPGTINEFPFWTFLFADLHPHMIAMPFALLVVGIALNWMLGQASGVRGQESGVSGRWSGHPFRVALSGLWPCLLAVLSLGALGAINTWDLPVYALLVAAALLLAAWRRGGALRLPGAGALAGALGGLAVAAYWPFHSSYQPQLGGGGGPLIARYLDWVRAASPFWAWLGVWGFFVVLALAFVLIEARRWLIARAETTASESLRAERHTVVALRSEAIPSSEDASDASGVGNPLSEAEEWPQPQPAGPEEPSQLEPVGFQPPGDQLSNDEPPGDQPPITQSRPWLLGLLALLGLALFLVVADRPTAALLVAPIGLAAALAVRRTIAAENAFLLLLVGLGLSIVAGTELVFLRDFLQGSDWYRMNTLFKFGVPAWLFLGLAGGAMFPLVWAALGRRGALGRGGQVVLALLAAAGLAFLPLGIPSRIQDRFPGARPAVGTLDGMAFMTVGRYTWPDEGHLIDLAYDYLAICWLLDNVKGTPVIAEAPAGGYELGRQNTGVDYYRAGALRVSSLTGLPTFVGHHQYEQRPGDLVNERLELGKEFYATGDISRARELIRELRIGYIYVGTLERFLFAPEGVRKFEVMEQLGDLEVAYQNAQVTIFRVTAAAR